MNQTVNDFWTAERITVLTKLWHENLTTATIAAAMQLTRNQVIGKAHRLGLPARPSPIKGRPGKPTSTAEEFRQRNTERTRAWRARTQKDDAKRAEVVITKDTQLHRRGFVFVPGGKSTTPMPEEVPDERAGTFTLVEVLEARTCKWPSNHVPNMTFCGRQRDPHDPNHNYCRTHHLRSVRFVTAAE